MQSGFIRWPASQRGHAQWSAVIACCPCQNLARNRSKQASCEVPSDFDLR